MKRIELEKIFIPMLAAAGLDMALMNMRHVESIQCLRTCDLLLEADVFAWGALDQSGLVKA